MMPASDPAQRASSRQRRPAAYSPELLVAVAVGAFNERGYDGTSLEDLARATGLSKSSIYHHVSGKEELLRLGVGRAIDALFAILEEPAVRTGTPGAQLRHVIRRTTEVLVAEIAYVTLLLRVRGNTETERWALERRREFDRQVAAIVAKAAAAGEIRRDVDARLLTRLVFGMVNSVAEWYQPHPYGTADEVSRAVLSIVFEGLPQRAGVELQQ